MIKINLLSAEGEGAVLAPPVETPPMPKRKALSKRTRFEIFKRDGFKCFYCGATPIGGATMDISELVLDHVKPVKEGGETAPHNLVTACVPCNAGKSAVPLEKRKYEPSTVDAQREHAEQLAEFLQIQRAVADTKEAHLDGLIDDWDRLTGLRQPHHLRGNLRNLVKEYTLDQLREAMEILSGASLDGPAIPYFRGILRNLGKPFVPKEKALPPTPAEPEPARKAPLGAAARLERVRLAVKGADFRGHRTKKGAMVAAFLRVIGELYLPGPDPRDWWEDAIERGQLEFEHMGMTLVFEPAPDGQTFRWRITQNLAFNPNEEVAEAIYSDVCGIHQKVELAVSRGETVDFRGVVEDLLEGYARYRNWESSWIDEMWPYEGRTGYVYKNPLRVEGK